ncbi:DUF2606 family protein [Laceyella sediminis]|jgi:uncharacterized lipoprotein YajG|uniref:DUF2606 family protein n=1 Tax=Laceyella sediminis TaxID=573074 RepID=UPI000D05D27A|nr:DUF2606 family protein [Laceyella sediminis]
MHAIVRLYIFIKLKYRCFIERRSKLRILAGILACFILAGCAHEESKQPKLSPVTIRVLDQEGKPVSRVAVGITVVIPEEEKERVGAIPVAVYTNENGEIKDQLVPGRKYIIQIGSMKKEVVITDKPMVVELTK